MNKVMMASGIPSFLLQEASQDLQEAGWDPEDRSRPQKGISFFKLLWSFSWEEAQYQCSAQKALLVSNPTIYQASTALSQISKSDTSENLWTLTLHPTSSPPVLPLFQFDKSNIIPSELFIAQLSPHAVHLSYPEPSLNWMALYHF